MNLGSANKAKPSRGNYHVIIKSKSLPRLDRHVFKIDKIKFDLSPSSSSEKSTSSYQSSL